VDSEDYHSVFPDVGLRADSKAAGRWSTSKGGEYFAIGIGGAVTGKGADLLIIDDPHDEQEGQSADPTVFDHAYEWYTSGPRQRLQPGGAIVVICTRWSKRDLVGQVLKASSMREGVDEWEVIEFPAIMPSGQPLWPEFWPLAELEAIRNEIPIHKWQAQYQQDPTSEEGALIKREWWKVWEERNPPQCQFLIQSWDTAFLKKERADYSACTTWGVFYHPDQNGAMQPNLILMDALKEKMEFPTLKKRAYELYQYWKPETLIVEAKAAGTPLIFELRAMGIPVAEYTPSRGNDKIARVNAVADLFASGKIWRPQTRFAEEVVEEFASFPAGEHDDYVDSGTQALLRYRRGGFISLQSDAQDEPVYRRKVEYY
jgi:predicted phage terminase large subunit-like protein